MAQFYPKKGKIKTKNDLDKGKFVFEAVYLVPS